MVRFLEDSLRGIQFDMNLIISYDAIKGRSVLISPQLITVLTGAALNIVMRGGETRK
jgi:hypothetical protein